jgi:hypothetical protein
MSAQANVAERECNLELQFGKPHTEAELASVLGAPVVELNVPWRSLDPPGPPVLTARDMAKRNEEIPTHERPVPGMLQFRVWKCSDDFRSDCWALGDPFGDRWFVRLCDVHGQSIEDVEPALSADDARVRENWLGEFWQHLKVSLNALERPSAKEGRFGEYSIRTSETDSRGLDDGSARVRITNRNGDIISNHSFSVQNAAPLAGAVAVAAVLLKGKWVEISTVEQTTPRRLRLVGLDHATYGLRFSDDRDQISIIPIRRLQALKQVTEAT